MRFVSSVSVALLALSSAACSNGAGLPVTAPASSPAESLPPSPSLSPASSPSESPSPSPSESPSPSPSPSSASIALAAKDFSFAPAVLAFAIGKPVTLVIDNTGQSPHTFTSTDLGVDQNVDAGKKATVTFTPTRAGTFTFICKYHVSIGMKGRVTVS